MRIDAHVHLPADDPSLPLAEKKARLLREMARNHVDRCLVIADSWPESEIGSTEDCVSLFPAGSAEPVRVIGGISPLVAFSGQLEGIRRYLERKQIAGIKLYTGHEPFYLTDERLEEVYSLAERFDAPVLFHSGWDRSQFGDAAEAAATAERHPDLKLVCCHCWYPHIARCGVVIRYPNLYFDLSSIADDPAVWNSIRGEAEKLIRAAPDRVIFGSDTFGCDMRRHIEAIRSLRLPPDIERRVFAENAAKLYGF